jgi:putative transposase
MYKSHVIKLYPTKEQETFFRKSSGVSRFAYNWALQRWKEIYEETGKGTSAYSLIKELNSIKREEFPWMIEVGKCAPQYAIHNVGKFLGLPFARELSDICEECIKTNEELIKSVPETLKS